MENKDLDRDTLREKITTSLNDCLKGLTFNEKQFVVTFDEANRASVHFKDEGFLRTAIGSEYGGWYQEKNYDFEEVKTIISSIDGTIIVKAGDKEIIHIENVFPEKKRMEYGAWMYIIRNAFEYIDEGEYDTLEDDF